MPERSGAPDARIRNGYVHPLTPDAVLGDLDINLMADVTDEMTRTGYLASRSQTFIQGPVGTVAEIATSALFNGDEEHSRVGYDDFLDTPDRVIGPYVRKLIEGETGTPRYGIALWNDLRRGMRRQEGDISWGIIGAGTIGGRVIEQLGSPEIAERSGLSIVPDFVLRKKTGITFDGQKPREFGESEELPDVDMLFVATPGISGEASPVHRHILRQLERRGIVVTAEKASLAEHFDEYREASDDFARFGMQGTAGGGTRYMDVLGSYTQDLRNVNQLHLGLNGTLAFISSQVANGVAAGIAVDQAVSLGYAEPEATDVEDVIRGEATEDVPRKISVVMSRLLLESAVDPSVFNFELSDSEIGQSLVEARDRRFITSIYRTDFMNGRDEQLIDGVLGGHASLVDDWLVVSGFQRIYENPLTAQFESWHGATAGAVIGLGPNNKDGVYSFHGPGAGANPTANAMLDDAQTLIEKQRKRA